MARLTIAEAKAELKQLGVTLTKRDGEFRVNVSGASELHAYYTDDITDAVASGRVMALRSTPEGQIKRALHLIKTHIGAEVNQHNQDLHNAVQLIVSAARFAGILLP